MSKPENQNGQPPRPMTPGTPGQGNPGQGTPPQGTPPKGTPPRGTPPPKQGFTSAGTAIPPRPKVERAPTEKEAAAAAAKPLGPLSSRKSGRAVALKYDQDSGAPIVIASGMGYMAERMVEVAEDNGVPIFEDTSLATVLAQLQLGQQIPPELYKAIVDIYIYFLQFDPKDPDKMARLRAENRKKKQAEEATKRDDVALEEVAAQEEEPEPPREKTAEEQMAELYENF